MATTATLETFDDRELIREVNALRGVDARASLASLAFEYLCLFGVIGGAIWVFERRPGPWVSVPVAAAAIVLIGALQHRLAAIGHEAAHFLFLKRPFWNDLIADLFCMLPVLTTVHLYRTSHLAHHQYTNDPDRDPNVVGTGEGKGIHAFPMPRGRFLRRYLLGFLFAPRALVRYEWDYIRLNMLGISPTVYERDRTPGELRRGRIGVYLGVAYLAGFVGVQRLLTTVGHEAWLPAIGVVGVLLVAAILYGLPEGTFGRPALRHPYSGRFAALLRLGVYTAALVAFGLIRPMTGGRSAAYFFLLWIAPLASSFIFFLFLRDVYQHANADGGKLTNTRVFDCGRFTRWAVLMYGQGMHLPHHLFPSVPHHRLDRLHALLKTRHPGYAATAVEVRGTWRGLPGRPSIVEVMAGGRPAPAPADGPGADR